MRTMASVMAVAVLAMCAGNAAPNAAAAKGKPDIVYEAFGCPLVACPAYRIAIWRNGQGVFTGISNTVIAGEGKFSVTEEQYSAFAGTLERYRPKRDTIYDAREGGPCAAVAPDQASVQVTWSGGRKLYYNYGCDEEKHADLASALANAPRMLPVGPMIARAR